MVFKKESTFFIHAANIHQGGGRYLLDSLLKVLPLDFKSILTIDDRMLLPHQFSSEVQVKRTKSNIIHRFFREWWLVNNVKMGDLVLCFGNLPPLFKSHGHVLVFLQNRYLIDKIALNNFPLRIRFRILVERLWLSYRLSNADEFIVQTPTMKKLMHLKTRGSVPISVLPFVADPKGYARCLSSNYYKNNFVYDFVYVASGEPHKNHRKLIEAWCLLAQEGLFPSLCITLDVDLFSDLCRFLDEQIIYYGVKVTNAGGMSHQDVLELYKTSKAAIYPSTFESFGLPLIEARQAGLPVLASELDYVRDVLEPEQSFDPESSVSIARAVKRFIGKDDQSLPIVNALQFLSCVLAKAD